MIELESYAAEVIMIQIRIHPTTCNKQHAATLIIRPFYPHTAVR